MPDPATRRHLIPPSQINVDFRAACFCHKRVVDIGFVCSICLSSQSSPDLHFASYHAPFVLSAHRKILVVSAYQYRRLEREAEEWFYKWDSECAENEDTQSDRNAAETTVAKFLWFGKTYTYHDEGNITLLARDVERKIREWVEWKPRMKEWDERYRTARCLVEAAQHRINDYMGAHGRYPPSPGHSSDSEPDFWGRY